MNYVSHPMHPDTMNIPNIPAAFDGSHASLIDIDGLQPSYKNLWTTWSCIPINTQTPYGDMAADARRELRAPRPPLRRTVEETMRRQGEDLHPLGKRSATDRLV